jgi:hypothetical protein
VTAVSDGGEDAQFRTENCAIVFTESRVRVPQLALAHIVVGSWRSAGPGRLLKKPSLGFFNPETENTVFRFLTFSMTYRH